MKARLITVLAGLAGLALAVWLIFHEGIGGIAHVLQIAGWNLLWLIPLRLLPVVIDARGWQALIRPFDPERLATLPFLSWIATVREAVNRLLPVANVGGEFVGIRLALRRPLRGAAVTASVIVETLLTVANQYLFCAIGIILLVLTVKSSPLSHGLLIGLVVALPLPIGLYFLLRNLRLFERMKGGLVRLLGAEHRLSIQLAGNAAALDEDLHRLLRMPAPLLRALSWQLVGMVVGSFETWFTLALLGHPVSLWDALILESLSLAVRHFAFFVPGGVGVQEASLVLLGSLIGLPADVAVALSLAKRLREVGFGLPALLSWQWAESRNLHLRTAPRAP